MVERSGVLVEDGLVVEETLVPRDALLQAADGHGDMGDTRERGH